jgi:hypothetical protein
MQRNIDWLTNVLDHDIKELKEALETILALRAEEESYRDVTNQHAAGKREEQGALLERVKNLAEYTHKVCVRRNEVCTAEIARATHNATSEPSIAGVEWVPVSFHMEFQSPEDAHRIFHLWANMRTFTLEDFTHPEAVNPASRLYCATFKIPAINDGFTQEPERLFYGWTTCQASGDSLEWLTDTNGGMVDGAPCIISDIFRREGKGNDSDMVVDALVPTHSKR